MAKSACGASSANYLGYTLTGEGIAPGKEKLLAVKEFPPPVAVKQILEFVGPCNYFRCLIPKFAYYLAILTNLSKAKSGTQVANCLLLPCQLLSFLGRNCESPLVRHPRKVFTFHLATDACAGDDLHRGGFGAVLTQV